MAANDTLIDLRRILADRVPSARLGVAEPPPASVIPTGLDVLDRVLGGGLPAGETVELVGEGPGSGTAQVLHGLLARSSADGRFLALVDGADSFDADAAEAADLSRLLWVRCREASQALQAADILLRDRNFPLVVLDLKLNPVTQLRRIPGTVWHRFGRLLEQQRTALLVVTPQALVSGASVRVRCIWRAGVESLAGTPGSAAASLRFEVLRQTPALQVLPAGRSLAAG
jgi:hypothetical protein